MLRIPHLLFTYLPPNLTAGSAQLHVSRGALAAFAGDGQVLKQIQSTGSKNVMASRRLALTLRMGLKVLDENEVEQIFPLHFDSTFVETLRPNLHLSTLGKL